MHWKKFDYSDQKFATVTVPHTSTQNNKMSAAMNKLNKAMHVFAEETALAAIDDFITAFKARVELDDDDLAFIEKYKADFSKKAKEQAAKKPKKEQKMDENGNVIKRKPTEYNLFVQAKMEELKKAHPDVKGNQLMAMAAAEWKKEKGTKSDSE